MSDLFGFIGTTTPTISASAMPKLINASFGFAEWWAAYAPGHPRKVGKQKCLNLWAKLECASSASHIKEYTLWMMQSPDWTKDSAGYVPMPATFLARQGWEDWTPPAPPKPKHDILKELREHRGSKPSADTLAKLKAIRDGK